MDDLKLFCRNQWELTQTVLEANETSQVIGMELGINKCAVAHVVKGKLREEGLVSLLDGRWIRAATMGEPYKYLGVLQVFDHSAPLTRKNVVHSYVKRIHRIWSSNLNSRNITRAMSLWAVPVCRYYFTAMKWSRMQTRALDKTTRRNMRKYKCHQRGSAPERLSMPRKVGGRGLQDLQATWEKEVVSAALYLIYSEDPTTKNNRFPCDPLHVKKFRKHDTEFHYTFHETQHSIFHQVSRCIAMLSFSSGKTAKKHDTEFYNRFHGNR